MEKEKNKKRLIMETAEKLFMTKGFGKTSVENITKECKTSKGNFYTYFSSKEELLEEIVKEALSGIYDELKNIAKKEKDILKIIMNYVELNIKLAKEYSPAIIISLREVALFKESSSERNLSKKMFEEIRKTIENYFKKFVGRVTEDDVTFVWGITLAIWIEVAFEAKVVHTESISRKILYGISGGAR